MRYTMRMGGRTDSQEPSGAAAPAELFEQHRQMIFRFILKRVGDPDIAEDLVQETFLRFHRSYASLQDKQALAAWLRSIAGNLCIDYHRAAARQRSQLRDGEAELEQTPPEPPDDSPPPLQLAEKQAQST